MYHFNSSSTQSTFDFKDLSSRIDVNMVIVPHGPFYYILPLPSFLNNIDWRIIDTALISIAFEHRSLMKSLSPTSIWIHTFNTNRNFSRKKDGSRLGANGLNKLKVLVLLFQTTPKYFRSLGLGIRSSYLDYRSASKKTAVHCNGPLGEHFFCFVTKKPTG